MNEATVGISINGKDEVKRQFKITLTDMDSSTTEKKIVDAGNWSWGQYTYDTTFSYDGYNVHSIIVTENGIEQFGVAPFIVSTQGGLSYTFYLPL